MKPLIFGVLTLGLASIASAQALTAAEAEVNVAFATLRGMDKVYIQLVGTDTYGATATPIQSDFFWDRPLLSTAQDMKFEMIESKNGIQSRRIVGDGRHVWGIDLAKSAYSASLYGSYTATKPVDYETNGLQNFNLLAGSQSSLLARMTREIWGGTTSQYRSWIPASDNRSESVIAGGATLADPVVPTRIYTSTPAKKFNVYWITKGGVNVRSLTFEMDENTYSGNYDLTAIYYSDFTSRGGVNRLVNWKATVYTGVLPATGNFVYTPLPGSRAVAGPRPNGGG